MEETSHRTYLMWQAWLDQQWNRPSRTDHYLMQIAAWVRRLWLVVRGYEGEVELEAFKLPFGVTKTTTPQPSSEGQGNQAVTPEQEQIYWDSMKAVWRSRMSKRAKYTPPPSERN